MPARFITEPDSSKKRKSTSNVPCGQDRDFPANVRPEPYWPAWLDDAGRKDAYATSSCAEGHLARELSGLRMHRSRIIAGEDGSHQRGPWICPGA